MCGLAGIVGAQVPSNRQALRRMNDAMAHRGPDGEGVWEAEPDVRGWGPMLAHRRLSILDLSTAAAQPMTDPASGDVVVLNGEIYNYRQLRAGLGDDGRRLESSGDTAVMLRVLSQRGVGALCELRGMFAIAFWDHRRRLLTLARDPLGIKPLYIARNPDPCGEWSLAFASEVRAILASGLLGQARLNPEALQSVVWNGFPVSPATIVRDLESAWPGEALTVDDRGQEKSRQRFWQRVPFHARQAVDEDAVRQELETSVAQHLASDVPLGVFLSGGIDSSAVANLAHSASTSEIHTFTLAFEETKHDEGGFAKRIAAAIGTEHQEVLLSHGQFLAQLDDALNSLDQPTFDGINSFVMSRAVRDAGFKVALVGTGGDELFGGYTSFRDLPRVHAWSQRLQWLPMEARVAAARAFAKLRERGRGEVPPQTRWAKLPEMLRRADSLLGLYQLAYGLFLPDFQAQLLANSGTTEHLDLGLPAEMRARLAAEIAGQPALASISILEQRLFLGERLLRDTDAASMAASIEIRLPLVDTGVLSMVERLPEGRRFRPIRSKAMLRRAGLRGLDPALFDRPKQGFELPYENWLKGALGERIASTLRDCEQVRNAGLDPDVVARLWRAFVDGAPGLYWTRIWALYVLVWWCQKHRVSV
jgi:asparagine synthase (glutamine-hydrolysing)